MNWQIGLAVAVEINLKTLSAAKPPVGIQLTQFLVSPLLSTEALTWKLLFVIEDIAGVLLVNERTILGVERLWTAIEVGTEFGGIRVFKLGFRTTDGHVTVGIAPFIGGGLGISSARRWRTAEG